MPGDKAAHATRAMRYFGCGCAPVVEDTENLELSAAADAPTDECEDEQ